MCFLRDNTFGTFVIHPVFGYLLCCYIQYFDWTPVTKVIVLDAGVYILSYTWSHFVQKIPVVKKFFGTK